MSKEVSLDEYNTLREEILVLFRREVSIMTLGLTGTAVIIGYAITKENALISLVPLLLLTLTTIELINIIFRFLYIAVYIRTRIEPNIEGLNWENSIANFREYVRNHQKKHKTKSFSCVTYTRVTICMGFICVALSFLFSENIVERMISAVSLASWLIFAYYILRETNHINSGELEGDFEKAFEDSIPYKGP